MIAKRLKGQTAADAEKEVRAAIERNEYVYDARKIFDSFLSTDVSLYNISGKELICVNRVVCVYKLTLVENPQNEDFVYYVIQRQSPFEYFIHRFALGDVRYVVSQCV